MAEIFLILNHPTKVQHNFFSVLHFLKRDALANGWQKNATRMMCTFLKLADALLLAD
jgi:hypothetical protein